MLVKSASVAHEPRLTWFCVSFGVLPVAILIALFSFMEKSWAQKSEIVISASETALLVWIADGQDLFRKHGLNVKLKLFQSGLRAAEAVIKNEADLSTTADAAFVNRSFRFADLRILASISTLETARLIGRRDRGIRNAADLAGKRVGVTQGSAGEYFLTRYLTLQGIPLSAPRIVDLRPADISNSLVNGDIDAGLTWEPFIRNAEVKLNSNAVKLPGQIDLIYHFLVITKQRWIEENAENTKAILAALIDAEKFALNHPQEAKAIVQSKFGYESSYIDHLWPLHYLHVSLPQALLFVLERQADWQIEKHLTPSKTKPNFLDLVETKPLAEVQKAAVGIVK